MSQGFAFQFIAGKYEGGYFVLPSEQDLLIGRGAELDIVLIEDMVSRRHASLSTHDGRLVLQDLHSTNGTFVNGERIEQCELTLQDRVLIGTSILRVTKADEMDALLQVEPAETTEVDLHPHDAGALTDLGVLELLRLLASRRRTGLLFLEGPIERYEVVLVDGVVSHAQNTLAPRLQPSAALAQALGLTEGSYQFSEPAEGFERPTSFHEENDATLKAAKYDRSQIDAMMKQAWPKQTKLTLAAPQPLLWAEAELTPPELNALQLAWAHGHIDAMLAHASIGALELFAALTTLCQRGLLQKGPASASA